eukprot:scaffold290543_cov23-Tisochrysis_lutea.AAC.1
MPEQQTLTHHPLQQQQPWHPSLLHHSSAGAQQDPHAPPHALHPAAHSAPAAGAQQLAEHEEELILEAVVEKVGAGCMPTPWRDDAHWHCPR